MLKEDKLDRGILHAAIVVFSEAHPESRTLDDHIRLLGRGARSIPTSRMPGSVHSHALPVGHQPIANVGRRCLPIVSVQSDVLLGDGQAAGDAAPVGRHPDPATNICDVPACLVVQDLDPQAGGVAGASHPVTETFCASLWVGSLQGKVSGLAGITAWPGGVPFADTVSVALAVSGAGHGAGAGPAGGIVRVAHGTLVALRASEASAAQTVPGAQAPVGQFIVLVAAVHTLSSMTPAVAADTGAWVKPGDPLRAVVAVEAPLTVDSCGLVPAVETDASARILACGVQTPHLSLHLRVEVALVRMAEALAHLAVIARYELSRPPSLLVEHWTAGVAEGATGVVPALALVVAGLCDGALGGVAVAGALASDGDVFY